MATNIKHKPPILKLTQRQEFFAQNLFKGMTQRDSWINAGYSSNYPVADIDSHACNLAKTDKIKTRIAELNEKTESALVSTVTERKRRLTELQRANLVDFIRDGEPVLDKSVPNHGAAAEYSVQTRTDDQGNVVTRKTIKLRDPVAAIAEHNRMERIGMPDTVVLQDNRSINFIVSQDGKELGEGVAKRLKEIADGKNGG